MKTDKISPKINQIVLVEKIVYNIFSYFVSILFSKVKDKKEEN